MRDSEKHSIFDEASKKLGKKKEKPVAKPPQKIPDEPLQLEEAQEMINRIRRLNEEIEEKLNSFYKHTGISGQKLHEYLSDPRHLKAEVWQKIESDQDKLETQIAGALGLGYKKHKERLNEKITKDRKGKTLGERRRWLPMR